MWIIQKKRKSGELFEQVAKYHAVFLESKRNPWTGSQNARMILQRRSRREDLAMYSLDKLDYFLGDTSGCDCVVIYGLLAC